MTEEQRKKLAYEAMEARLAQIPNSSVPVIEAKAVEQSPTVEEPLQVPVPSVTVESPVVQPVVEPVLQTSPVFDRTIEAANVPYVVTPEPVSLKVADEVPNRPVDDPYLQVSKPVNYRAVLSWVAFLVFIVVVAAELYLFVFN